MPVFLTKIYLYLYFTLIFLYFFNFPHHWTQHSFFLCGASTQAPFSELWGWAGRHFTSGWYSSHLWMVLCWICCGRDSRVLAATVSPAVPFNHVLVKTVPLKLHVHFAFVSLKNEAWFLKQFIGGERGNNEFLLKICRTLQRRCNNVRVRQ